MALVKCKPTSAGRRHVVKVVNSRLAQRQALRPFAGKEQQIRWS